MSEVFFYIVTTGAGFVRIRSHPNLISLLVAMVSQGFMDALPQNTFRIMVSNLSKNPIYLLKRMFVGIEVEVSNIINSFSVEGEESVNSISN